MKQASHESTEGSDDRALDPVPSLKVLRAEIPQHCFEPSLYVSMRYVAFDLLVAVLLPTLAWRVSLVIDHSTLRFFFWTGYGFLQGLVMTGIWILAHECGHDAFSLHRRLNAVIGFFLHSILLVPFFSWKFTHARHHRFANHMEKDTVFVPPSKSEWRSSLWTGDFLGHATDTPLVSLLLLTGHQLLGWPVYIFTNAGAGIQSLSQKDRSSATRQNHLDPGAHIFSRRECRYVLLSNLGIGVMLLGLWRVAQVVGLYEVCLLYGVPYLWMNHWIVAITFLHHTHPDVPHYTEDTWTYKDGALSTIDRDFGFIGRHMFHGIIEYHVIHHMFPRIPFYHAEEATKAVVPLLGKAYKRQKTPFLSDLWTTFTTCQYVEESGDHPGQLYWSRAESKL